MLVNVSGSTSRSSAPAASTSTIATSKDEPDGPEEGQPLVPAHHAWARRVLHRAGRLARRWVSVLHPRGVSRDAAIVPARCSRAGAAERCSRRSAGARWPRPRWSSAALIGLARPWPDRLVGLVLAFGAGALISAVSFDLSRRASGSAGPGTVAVGLAVGALTYFTLDGAGRAAWAAGGGARARRAARRHPGADGARHRHRRGGGRQRQPARGDLRLQPAGGDRRLDATCATPGHRPRTIRRLWLAVAVVCTLATVAGYALADATSGDLQANINGFAAGALLVMLVDSMIPEAARKAGAARRPGHGRGLRGRRRAVVTSPPRGEDRSPALPGRLGSPNTREGGRRYVSSAADYPFLNILWTMIIFFCWVAWIWMLIVVLQRPLPARHLGLGEGRVGRVPDHLAVPRRADLHDRRGQGHDRAPHA